MEKSIINDVLYFINTNYKIVKMINWEIYFKLVILLFILKYACTMKIQKAYIRQVQIFASHILLHII